MTTTALPSSTSAEIIKVDALAFGTLPCLLLTLILEDEALVDDAGSQAQLEFVLLDALIEELYESDLATFLLLCPDAVIPRLHFCILHPQSELFCHLVELHIICRHRFGNFVDFKDDLGTLSHEVID